MTEQQVLELLKGVNDPEIGRSLVDLEMVKQLDVGASAVQVGIDLPTPAYPDRERITHAIKTAIQEKFPAAKTVTVNFSASVRGKNSGGTIGLRIKNIIAVGSGKGGVGKSTISAALAYGLKHYGARVGLMDADVYGPSIPHLVGATGQPVIRQVSGPNGQSVDRIEPVLADGIPVMSMGFMVEKDQAVVWRGPMLHRALTQFLSQTEWGELDYLIIDMPPGTGDVALTLSQTVGLAGAVVVCTPQQVALLDAIKAISMFNTVKVPVLGMVENMSGDIFGRGGTRDTAAQRGVPFLGEVPSDATIRIKGDEGKLSELFSQDNPSREPLLSVCQQTAIEVTRQLLKAPQMPTLEIL